jgi:acetyl esterase/lipase
MRGTRDALLWACWLTLAFPRPGVAQDNGPPYPPTISDATVEVFKVVDGVELKLWILFPDGHSAEDSSPAVVFFFGGGWTGGTPGQFERQARVLRSHGIVAVLADYRVLRRNSAGPSVAVEDAKSAVRWIRSRSGELGIDPARIGAAGGSSGGHLAAATATLPGFDSPDEDHSISSEPNALVLFNPVVIVAPVAGVWETPTRMLNLMDGPLMDLSPFHHARPDTPPTLILHGTQDESVPLSTVVAYCEHLTGMGAECEVVSYEGAVHGFFNRDPYYGPTLERALQFLTSLGWTRS